MSLDKKLARAFADGREEGRDEARKEATVNGMFITSVQMQCLLAAVAEVAPDVDGERLLARAQEIAASPKGDEIRAGTAESLNKMMADVGVADELPPTSPNMPTRYDAVNAPVAGDVRREITREEMADMLN